MACFGLAFPPGAAGRSSVPTVTCIPYSWLSLLSSGPVAVTAPVACGSEVLCTYHHSAT